MRQWVKKRSQSSSSDPISPTEPMETVANYTDVTEADEVSGAQAMAAGEIAVVISCLQVDPLTVIPGLDTSLLAWRLMQCGGVPVWVVVKPAQFDAICEYVKTLVLAPGLEGNVVTQDVGQDLGVALREADVFKAHPTVKQVFVCNVGNVLGGPHDGLIGFHRRGTALLTQECLAGGLLRRVPTGAAVTNIEVLKQPAQLHNTCWVTVPADARFCYATGAKGLDAAGKLLISRQFKP